MHDVETKAKDMAGPRDLLMLSHTACKAVQLAEMHAFILASCMMRAGTVHQGTGS